jgi:hypothetical protein
MTGRSLTQEVKTYLDVQLVAMIMLELSLHAFGFEADVYRVVYCCCTIAIFGASWRILRSSGYGWPAGLFGLIFATALLYGASHSGLKLDLDDWIILLEGAGLAFLGMALGFKAPFSEHHETLTTLSVLWLSLSAFNFCFALNRTSPFWVQLGDWLTYWLVITAMSWIGLRSGWRPRFFLRRQPNHG